MQSSSYENNQSQTKVFTNFFIRTIKQYKGHFAWCKFSHFKFDVNRQPIVIGQTNRDALIESSACAVKHANKK